jgi:hypothetical protein
MPETIQKFVCDNPKCTVLSHGSLAAGRGIVKEFRHWSATPEQKTPACISCGKLMKVSS